MTRNPFLDSLRGALAWAIVGVHCVWFTGYGGPIQHQVGVWVVNAFLAISGYVTSLSLLRRQEPYLDFILRRVIRLLPVFLACLLLSLLVRPFVLGTAPAEAGREADEHQFFLWHLVTHLSLIHGIVPSAILPNSPMALLPPAWYVSLQFQLYLLAPATFFVLRKWGRPVALAGLFCSSLLLFRPFNGPLVHYWTEIGAFFPQRFYFFLLGMTFGIYPLRLRPKWKIHYPSTLVYFGAISYPLYLVHWPIIAVFNALFGWVGNELPPDLYAFFLFLACSPFALLSAMLLHEFVEKPCISFFQKQFTPKGLALSS